jgi:hypothetical protein
MFMDGAVLLSSRTPFSFQVCHVPLSGSMTVGQGMVKDQPGDLPAPDPPIVEDRVIQQRFV